MEIDNNNNQDSDSDDPTLELEPLSEAACNKMMQADDAPAESDAIAETEESHEICTSAPVSGDTAPEIQGLRDELKYLVDMNIILRHENDQLRERCERLAEQVSGLLNTSETFSNELERSHQQVKRMKQPLAAAQPTEQALSINSKKLDKEDAANAVIKKHDGAIEDLRRENLELTDTLSDPEAKLASAGQEAEQRRSSGARRTSPTRSPGTGLAPGSEVQDCLVLLGASGVESDTWVLYDGINTIGSSPDCDIRIESKFVSRHHAQLIKTRNGRILEDLNSTNGTYLNSRRINKRALRAGDLVTIGKHRLRYRERSDHLIMTDLSKFGSGLQSGVT
jgi:regulator of replication initiation timing